MVDGLRPCIPGGTGSTCRSCPRREMYPCGTCYPCPGGEDHLKRRRRLRRIVPSPPVPPLLGCRHCPRRQTEFFSFASAAWVQTRGCKGRSPLHKKTKNSPFPPGRGAGGMGEKRKLKAGQGGNPNRQLPPSGTTAARSASAARVQCRGAGGGSPRRNKVIFSPFPGGEGGRGDGGKKASKRRGGQATKKASRPCGHHSGKVCKCRRRFSAGVPGASPPAPLRTPDWQRQPATEKKTPPPETTGGGVREKTIS